MADLSDTKHVGIVHSIHLCLPIGQELVLLHLTGQQQVICNNMKFQGIL